MIYVVLIIHWVADFILQSDAMAKNKSKDNFWLSKHVAVYMAPFFVLLGPEYAAVNAASHWGIDWCTSRFNSKMWAHGKVHEFFVGVGFDQLLHVAILIATLPLAKPLWSYL